VRGAAGHPLQPGKQAACDYFYAYELPLVQAWLAPVLQQTDLLARTSPEAL
jgi:hypothetical protein